MTIRMLGTSWCGDCARSKALLTRHEIPFEWIDIELDDDAAAELERLNGGRRVVPTILLEDGVVLVEPSDEVLGSHLGLV